MLPELKPYLTAFALPPLSIILLWGLAWWGWRRHRAWAQAAMGVGLLSLWWLSCPVVAVWLSRNLLPSHPMASTALLQAQQVQALVVLGGGVEVDLPDGVPQLGKHSLDRLRQGVQWARQTHLPLMFTGGVGWAGRADSPTEAEVAQRVAQDAFAWPLRWTESASRDTQENAHNSFRILSAAGIQRIGLVTDSWHMARSVRQFERAGFSVTPVPMGHPGLLHSGMDWLPDAGALQTSRHVIRERLGLWVAR
ncbi:MAG: YdcF family protein [Betaproteobacteria bacterium]|nr:YdcF family protein [Betaproteobacteria bacterium]